MNTKNEISKKQQINLLAGIGILIGLFLIAFPLFIMFNSGLSFKWFKKKPVPVVAQETKVSLSLEEFVQNFLENNFQRVQNPDDSISTIFYEDALVSPPSSYGKKIILIRLKECCYTPEEVYNYASKYRLPSVVWRLEKSQLGVSKYIHLRTHAKPKDRIALEMKFKRNPVYLVKSPAEFWIFDQNRKEMNKW